MNLNFKFASAAHLFLLFAISAGLAQQSSVLVGLRHDQKLSQPLPYGETAAAARQSSYRTLCIRFDAPDSISIREINKIVVPRNNQFWKIEVMRQMQRNWVEDQLICAPIDQQPEAVPLDSMTIAECEGHKLLSLLFVGTEFLCYEGTSSGYCQGAAHPWHVNYLKTVRLDDPGSEGIGISSMLTRDAAKAMQQGATKYWATAQDERLDPDPDERNWGVIRRRGQWVLRGQLDYSAEVFRGTFAHFDIDFKLPMGMVGFNELIWPWRKIRATVPDAKDAISSPDKKWLLVLTRSRLLMYAMPDWKQIRSSDMLPGEIVIMVQWADAAQSEQWREELANLLAP